MNETPYDWNARWREKAELPFSADSWLKRVLPLLSRGQALDLACGRGDNALFLAEEGWQVTAVDLSGEALGQLRREAAGRGLSIETIQADLEAGPRFAGEAFDLVLQLYFLHRPLLPVMKTAVRPGGTCILRTFSRAGNFPGGPANPAWVLEPGELTELFADWEILLHEEGLEASRKGGSLANIVARRPQ